MFYINVPKEFQERETSDFPALIFIHGYMSSYYRVAQFTGLHKDAPEKGYVTVFADANPGMTEPSWNAGDCCSSARYFSEMIDVLIAKYKVDPKKVFVSGWSNGGMMTYRLVCELSDKLAGAASFVGALQIKEWEGDSCKGDRWEKDLFSISYNYQKDKCDYEYWKKLPNLFSCEQIKEVPIMIINGKADPIVPYDGKYNIFPLPSNILLKGEEWFDTQPPAQFGSQYFREKYGCKIQVLEYYEENEEYSADYSSCIGTFKGEDGKCNTKVLECYASKGGHFWWNTEVPMAIFPEDLVESFGYNTKTFNLNNQIIKFFDGIQSDANQQNQIHDEL